MPDIREIQGDSGANNKKGAFSKAPYLTMVCKVIFCTRNQVIRESF